MIVSITYQDGNYVKVDSNNPEFLRNLDFHFTIRMPNFQWMPRPETARYKFYNYYSKKIPIGLLKEVKKFLAKYYPDAKIKISKKVVDAIVNDFYKDHPGKVPEDFWDHQERIYWRCLKTRRSTIEAYVSSGKTYLMGAIIERLFRDKQCTRAVVLVPLKQLVVQTAKEFRDMTGLNEFGICEYYSGKELDLDKRVIVSTWQSLNFKSKRIKAKRKKDINRLAACTDILIADEAHGAKAYVINTICQKFKHCTYKHGFTGTLPKHPYDRHMIFSGLGPKLEEVGPQELREKNIISKSKIYNLYIKYTDKFTAEMKRKDYNAIRYETFEKPKRLNIISRVVQQQKKNTLILVTNVKKEGKILEAYLKRNITGKEIVFLHGKVGLDKRVEYSEGAEKRNDLVIIATYGIFKMGISIRNIHCLVIASSAKSFIAVRQSLGRGLRNLEDKRLIVVNIIDQVPYLEKHGKERIKIFDEDDYEQINKYK